MSTFETSISPDMSLGNNASLVCSKDFDSRKLFSIKANIGATESASSLAWSESIDGISNCRRSLPDMLPLVEVESDHALNESYCEANMSSKYAP